MSGGACLASRLGRVTAPGHPSPPGLRVSGQCGAGSGYPNLPSEGGCGELYLPNTTVLPNLNPSPAPLICWAGGP